jgi:protein-S-isoprenylcysteine O-methyltransferase Ste14
VTEEAPREHTKTLRPFVGAVGFLVYSAITLEMIFMVTPFALYYYSAYSPFLSAAFRVRGLAWLPAFFLPHLSTEVLPSIGGLIVLVGIIGFLIGAAQIYYSTFRRRGVVKSGFYNRVRHPQYLFLGIAGLGLLLVWPRFILLVIYINVLWFYYFLARDEEERMRSRYGDAYLEPMQHAPMFIPGAPGKRLADLLFGWIRARKLRLFALYCLSLVGATVLAFVLRDVSLIATTHITLPDERIAAVSFLRGSEDQLRHFVQLARDDRDVQDYMNQENGWTLVQALEGKGSASHVMIDAGMPVSAVRALPITAKGIKLVLLHREGQRAEDQPFSVQARWRPFLVAQMDDRGALTSSTFLQNCSSEIQSCRSSDFQL